MRLGGVPKVAKKLGLISGCGEIHHFMTISQSPLSPHTTILPPDTIAQTETIHFIPVPLPSSLFYYQHHYYKKFGSGNASAKILAETCKDDCGMLILELDDLQDIFCRDDTPLLKKIKQLRTAGTTVVLLFRFFQKNSRLTRMAVDFAIQVAISHASPQGSVMILRPTVCNGKIQRNSRKQIIPLSMPSNVKSSKYDHLRSAIENKTAVGQKEAYIAEQLGISRATLKQLKQRWGIRCNLPCVKRRQGIGEKIDKMLTKKIAYSEIARKLKISTSYINLHERRKAQKQN